jgi:hypothetical protein
MALMPGLTDCHEKAGAWPPTGLLPPSKRTPDENHPVAQDQACQEQDSARPHGACRDCGSGRCCGRSGQANKVVSIDFANKTVTYQETDGFQGGKALRYASFDSSDPVAATLEHVTYAPALTSLPTLNDDSTASSRASLAAFTNGQTGVTNPQRQGLNAAILDGLDPLNVLRWNPTQGRYSPLWDAHLTQWQVPVAQRTRRTDFGNVQNLADHGTVVGFNGTAEDTTFAARGIVVNCPIVASPRPDAPDARRVATGATGSDAPVARQPTPQTTRTTAPLSPSHRLLRAGETTIASGLIRRCCSDQKKVEK